MGVHLCLQKQDGTEHPDWDWVRHSGDRDVALLLYDVPTEEVGDEDFPLMRPTDFVAFRAALSRLEVNETRFKQLSDILKEQPEYWMYFSW